MHRPVRTRTLWARTIMAGGQGIVEGGEIPYRPEALAQKKANAEKRMVVNISSDDHRHDTGDPELKCYMPGVPRANYMPFPFQIIQTPHVIMMAYEYARALRTIYTENDKTIPQAPPADSWMGWSHGHFEGDVLVVDSKGFVPTRGSIEREIITATRCTWWSAIRR